VRDFLSLCAGPAVWGLYLGTTVYGHVALKLAVDRKPAGDFRGGVFPALASHWAWSACLAWFVSCLLWALVLTRQPLIQANAVSSLRHLLIALAAWALLGESLNLGQTIGMVLIAVGIVLVR